MAIPDLPSEHGLSLFHAGRKTGEWRMAASIEATAWRGMARLLHSPWARRRKPNAGCSGDFLQSRLCRLLFVGSALKKLGCGTLCDHLSPGSETAIARRERDDDFADPFCLRTKTPPAG